MSYLVWIRGHGRLTPQVWAERSYAVDRRGEDARIAARHELTEEDQGLTLDGLAALHPPPPEVVP